MFFLFFKGFDASISFQSNVNFQRFLSTKETKSSHRFASNAKKQNRSYEDDLRWSEEPLEDVFQSSNKERDGFSHDIRRTNIRISVLSEWKLSFATFSRRRRSKVFPVALWSRLETFCSVSLFLFVNEKNRELKNRCVTLKSIELLYFSMWNRLFYFIVT